MTGSGNPSPPTDWRSVCFGLALSWYAAYALFKLPPVLPMLLVEYGYDRTLAGGFMSVYAVAGLTLSIALGRMVDRHGITRPVLGALAIMASGTLLSMAAPTSGALVLAGRGLEGVAFALLAICGPVIANRGASVRHLPVVIGLTAAWIPVGQLSATALAPVALAGAGWPLLWYAGLAGAAVLAVVTIRRGNGTAAARPTGQSATPVAPCLDPRQRLSLVLASMIFLLWSGQYFAYMTWLPQYFVEVHGLSPTQAAAGYALPVALVLVLTVVTGLIMRAGVPPGVLLCVALVAQTAVWLAIPRIHSGAAGIVSLIAYGIGAGVAPASLFAMPAVIAGKGGPAVAFGIIMTGRNLGVLLGPVVLPQILAHFAGWDVVAITFGCTTLVALALGLVLAVRLARD